MTSPREVPLHNLSRRLCSRRRVRYAVGLLGVGLWFLAMRPVAGQPAEEQPLPTEGAVIDVSAPELSLYRVAVPRLQGDGGSGQEVAAVLGRDFELVSLFKVLDPKSFVADLGAEGLGLVPASWTAVGAQGVIKGRVNLSGQRAELTLRLFELARGATPTLERSYSGSTSDLRGFAHRFANEVVQQLTGKAASFGTRIAFARRVGPGRKDVYLVDSDGHNVRRVSSGRGVSMLPSFGPGGIWYSVLRRDGMFITRTGIKDRPLIKSKNGLNMGVRACGGRILFTSTRDGNAEIYSSKPDGTGVKRLTRHPGIDVSPACGPGGKIAFVSNRHGSPQIFVMGPGGGQVKRVTYRGSHNQTPAWCPDPSKSLIAFTGRDGGLDVFTVDAGTGEYTRITQGQSAKDPAFSPDCRMLAFASTKGGIYVSSPEGLNHQRIVSGAAETLRWSRR